MNIPNNKNLSRLFGSREGKLLTSSGGSRYVTRAFATPIFVASATPIFVASATPYFRTFATRTAATPKTFFNFSFV